MLAVPLKLAGEGVFPAFTKQIYLPQVQIGRPLPFWAFVSSVYLD